MKKYFILILLSIMINMPVAKATMPFSEALAVSDVKPVVLLVYASWLQNSQLYLQQFSKIQQQCGNVYNYSIIDISDKSSEPFVTNFNMNKIPYIMTVKARGKIIRTFQKNCITDDSCIIPRVKSFMK